MINQPETRDLLTEARRVLLESLAPELAGQPKYEALMIANAMGMAIRELEQREQGQPEQTDRGLRAFLAERSFDISDNENASDDAAEAVLAATIRERKLDGADPALRSVLRTLTEARLRINNPSYVD